MSRLFVRGAKLGYSRQILRAAELLIAASDRLAARRGAA